MSTLGRTIGIDRPQFIDAKRTRNAGSVASAAVDVVLLRWPVEEGRRDALRMAGCPRLLLVEDDAVPPLPTDELEDWIRMPATEADLRARVEGVRRRATGWDESEPELDDDGVLRVGDRWVALPPVEARLMAALLARFGAVVSRESLSRSGWPDGAPGRNALDVHVLRLRRRIEKVSLAIRTIRSRGYLLERDGSVEIPMSGSGQQRVREA